MAQKDLYKILGVEKDADDKKLKSAYRKLAKKYHPDANPGDKAAEQKFKEVGEAYAILSDPEKRKLYDAYGFAAFEGGDPTQSGAAGGQSGFHYSGNGDGFQSFHFTGQDAEDLFESMFGDIFGRGRQAGGRSARGSSYTYSTGGGPYRQSGTYTYGGADDAFRGFTGAFGGSDGAFSGFGNARRESDLNLRTSLTIGFREAALGCKKTIRLEAADGSGPQTLEINIPSGIDEGKNIRLRGKGRVRSDGKKGDLLIEIHIAPDSMYTRKDLDIYTTARIPYTTAALGGEALLPTLHGEVSCRIPAGIQSGKQIRLKGKGIVYGSRTGDEYVEIQIDVPRTLTPKERSLLEELAAVQSGASNRRAS